MNSPAPIPFRANAIKALRDSALRAAMCNATETFTTKRSDAISGIPIEEWRDQASELRLRVLNNLADYVDRFETNATRAGAKVHRAKDSQEANGIIAEVLKDHGIQKVVKSKSMVSEEIHLNRSPSRSVYHASRNRFRRIYSTDCRRDTIAHPRPRDSQGSPTSGKAFCRKARL